jgi:hypothetical protein
MAPRRLTPRPVGVLVKLSLTASWALSSGLLALRERDEDREDDRDRDRERDPDQERRRRITAVERGGTDLGRRGASGTSRLQEGTGAAEPPE